MEHTFSNVTEYTLGERFIYMCLKALVKPQETDLQMVGFPLWTFTGGLDWGYLKPEKEHTNSTWILMQGKTGGMKCRWFSWWKSGDTGAKQQSIRRPCHSLVFQSLVVLSSKKWGFLIPTYFVSLFEVMCYFPIGKYIRNIWNPWESIVFFRATLSKIQDFYSTWFHDVTFFAPKKPQNQRWSTTNHRSYRLAYFTSVPGVILMCEGKWQGKWQVAMTLKSSETGSRSPLSLIKCVASPDELPELLSRLPLSLTNPFYSSGCPVGSILVDWKTGEKTSRF